MVSHQIYNSRCLLLNNSGKVTDEFEITPQSNYVRIFEDGECIWEPRYELSVSQCPVDVTWFPFDEQVCNLYFQSWVLDDNSIDFIVDNNSIDVRNLLPSDDWYLAGTFCWSTKNTGHTTFGKAQAL